MANHFAQYDEPDAPSPGPVKITVTGGTPQATTNGVAQGNHFSQYDEPTPAPKESLPDFAGRMATNLGIGAVQGAVSLPETPGALLDLIPAATGMRSLGTQDEPAPGVNLADQDRAFSQFMAQQYGAPDPNLPNGYPDDVRSKAWKEFVAAGGAPSPRAPQQSMGAALNEALRPGLKAVGLDFRSYFDPDQYFQPPKDDAEAYARTAGAMGVGMLLPGEWANAPTALGKLTKAGAEFATGAVGGMAGQKVAEGATNDQDRMAINALTMMGTGMAAHGVGKGLEAVGSQFGKVGDYLAPAVPWSNKRQIAAQKLANYVGDPNAVAKTLENAPEYVPGYKPTAAKVSGDAHLGALERSLARNDDAFNASLLNRQAENNARLTGTLQDVADQGSPAAAAEYFTSRMRELEDRANALYDQHATLADQRTQGLGDTPNAADIGQRARAELQGNFKTLNDQANRLWNSLPDDMTVPTAPITAVRDSIYKGMSPEDALSVQPIEHAIAGIIDDYGPDLTFDRFKRLRSRLTTAMREMARDGKGEARGRLSQLLNGVEEAMGQSIAERAAQDQQAVAAGRMAPEDALANRFLNDAKQVEAGDVAAPGNAPPEAASAAAVPRDTGAAGAAERGPSRAAGAEGFPRDAGNLAGERPYPARNLNEDTNGRPNPAAPVARPPLQSAEPRPASGPGGPGGAGVRQVPGKPAREGDGSLAGLPRKVGTHTASGWPEAQRVARDYMDKAGLEYDPPNTYAKVDPARAKRIADAYEAMKHDPQNPEVKAAYDAMAKETLAQYQAILDSGMTFDFIPEGFADPYNGNPRNMIEDVRTHKHMWVFPTKQGFGSDASFDVRDNPLLADSGFKISGQPATVNDIFRAVHDYFGHVKEGVGFRADGEENAWRAHSAMYSPEARKAMTSETRGQNSWVNYGPYGEANRTARSEDTHYADQKIGILPDWVIHEGARDGTVFDKLAEGFAASGQPMEVAKADAAVAEAFYNLVAKHAGLTPDQLFAQYPIEVRKGVTAPGGSLAQSSVGDFSEHVGNGVGYLLPLINSDTAMRQKAVDFVFEKTGKNMLGSPNAKIAEAAEAAAAQGAESVLEPPQKPSNSTEAALALPDLAKQLTGYSAQYAPAVEFAKAFKEYNFLNGGKETLATALAKPEAMEMATEMLKKNNWTQKQIVDNGGLLGAVEFEMNYAYGQLAADAKAKAAKDVEGAKPPYAAPASKNVNDVLYDALKGIVEEKPDHPLLNPKNVITDDKISAVSGYSSGMTGQIGGKADIAKDILQQAIKEDGWPEKSVTADGVILQIDNTQKLYNEANNWLHEQGVTDDMIENAGGTGTAFASAMMSLYEKGNAVLAKIEADVAAEKKKSQSFTEYASGKQINPFDPNFDGSHQRGSPRGILSQEFYDRVTSNPNFQSFMEDGGIEARNKSTGKMEPLVVYHGAPNHGFRYFSGDTFFAADTSTASSYGGSKFYKHVTPEEALSDPKELSSIFGHDPKVVQQGGYGKNIPYRVISRDPFSAKTSHIDFPDRRALLKYIDKKMGQRVPRHGYSEHGKAATAPFFIRMQNPYEVDFEGNGWSDAPPGEHDGWADHTKTEYQVYFDGDHYENFDNESDARDRLDELISERADELASEHRSEVQQKFSIVAPTPLFGDDTYKIRFEPKAGDDYYSLNHGQEWEADDLSEVQQIIEDAIDDEEMGARDHWAERLEENSSVNENEARDDDHHPMTTDDIVNWAKGEGYDGVIFRNIEDGGPTTDVFVTTEPEQVKSPFNIGSFDPNDEHFLFQPAAHASPYAFNKFELSPRTIRSGEGNLDFGHGLYFSSSDQARSYYRATVAGKNGHEYIVDLPENDELINWDTPVSQQSPYVQDALKRLPPQYRPSPNARGSDVYRKIADSVGDSAASEKLKAVGIPGHRYRDAGSRGSMPESNRTYNFVIYDDSRISIKSRTPVSEVAQSGQRGAIQLGDTGAIIHMLKNADATTGVHELSHQFLRMYQGIADQPHSPLPIRQDFAIIKDWWHKNAAAVAKDSGHDAVTSADVRAALERGTSGNPEMDAAINRGMQEQWARAFEKYLGEGVAPTAQLAEVFSRFKQWMLDVYKSLTGLNVDLSPEMRGVFDRMLGGKTPVKPPAKRIGAGEVEQYKKARAATLNLKETFAPRPVKDILKRPGSGYAYEMPDENVAGKLWRAGPEGGGQVKQIINAAGNTPEIKQAVTEAAVTSLKSKAMKNGRLDPDLLSKWRAQHASALSNVPDLGPKLNSVESAERALADIGQRRADAIKAVQKTAIGKLLNVTDDADVSRTLGSMLNGREAVKSMRELMAEAKKDPNAVAGLQSALAQHMLERLGSSRGGFRPDTYQRYLGKVAPALSQVLSPEQMNSFRAVAQELKREQRDVRAPGGGSDTAQNLAAARRFGLEKPTLLGRLWSSIGAPLASGAAAAVGLSPGGWMMQTISSLGAALGTHIIQQAREAGMETVMDLVRQAMLDPQMMAEMLKSAPAKANTGSHVSLATYLAKVGAASTRQSEDKKRRGFADGGTVATDGGDVYTSPPAWAAPIVAKLISDASNGGKIAGVIPNQPSGVI